MQNYFVSQYFLSLLLFIFAVAWHFLHTLYVALTLSVRMLISMEVRAINLVPCCSFGYYFATHVFFFFFSCFVGGGGISISMGSPFSYSSVIDLSSPLTSHSLIRFVRLAFILPSMFLACPFHVQ